MPVLPLVGSTIVAPGLSLPCRSARSTMFRQMRSLTEPPGLKDSIFAHTSASFFPVRVFNLTTGVEPMRSRTDRAPFKLLTVYSSFARGVKLELSMAECYSFVSLKSMKTADQDSSKPVRPRVCAIFPGALGDFICFLPALQSLTSSARVDLFARSEFAALVPPDVVAHSLERP